MIPSVLQGVVGQFTRSQVRSICRDASIHPLLGYAAVMAWGGQNFRFFDMSIQSRSLIPLLMRLKGSGYTRAEDFDHCLRLIPGVGIAYFTKLLFFFRPASDAYILDQWTAKGITFLCSPNAPIRLDRSGHAPAPDTRGREYEEFCKCIEQAASSIGWTPEQVEIGIFGKPMRGNYGAFPRPTISKEPAVTIEKNSKAVVDGKKAIYLRKAHYGDAIYAIAEDECGGINIGYVSRTGPMRAGEICSYPRMTALLTTVAGGIAPPLNFAKGSKHGAPAAVNARWGLDAGNIITNGVNARHDPQHAWAACGLDWLRQYFELHFCP